MDMLKPKINSNLAQKPKKGLPMDEVQVRQNEFLLQLQSIYALHCSFAILFFYHFFANLSPLSLLFPSRFSAKTERATPRTVGDLPGLRHGPPVICLGLSSSAFGCRRHGPPVICLGLSSSAVMGGGEKKGKKIENRKRKEVVRGWWGKKKREGGKIQRQQRECGRKIGKGGILGVVKYKRK